MDSLQPKKLLIVNILDILRRYTDETHCLSQKEIGDILRRDYGMTADRKAIKRNLMSLLEHGCEIGYTETLRQASNPKTGQPEESAVLSDFYLKREFTDGELRLLIDSVLFSRYIPYRQRRDLVKKLEGLSSRYFHARVSHVATVPDNTLSNKQLFYTIEVLDEAITREKQVSFLYQDCGLDKALHPRLDRDGRPRRYLINPYQMAAVNGRYYLICNYDKYDDVGNFRLDRIADIQLLDSPRKPMKQVRGLEQGLNLPRHMAEHIYMFPGESGPVTFRFPKSMVGEVMDWFGPDISFFDASEDQVTARVEVNLASMRRWALQYALHVRVLSPEPLVQQIWADLHEAAEAYGL